MHTLKARLTGFILSLILTFAAFGIILHPGFLGTNIAIAILFILALLQFVVQSICFLNVLGEKGARWNLLVFLSTLTIIIIIIVASLWIMHHLNYNMAM